MTVETASSSTLPKNPTRFAFKAISTADEMASARPAFQIWRKPQRPAVLTGPPSPASGNGGAGNVKVERFVIEVPAESFASILSAWVVPGANEDVGL